MTNGKTWLGINKKGLKGVLMFWFFVLSIVIFCIVLRIAVNGSLTAQIFIAIFLFGSVSNVIYTVSSR